MQEVCRAANVTRKAVEVGDRTEIDRARKFGQTGIGSFPNRTRIRFGRSVFCEGSGFPRPQIRAALHDEKTLNGAQACAALRMQTDEQKQTVLAELAKTGDYGAAMRRLSQIEKSASVLTRLLDLFPGSVRPLYRASLCAVFTRSDRKMRRSSARRLTRSLRFWTACGLIRRRVCQRFLERNGAAVRRNSWHVGRSAARCERSGTLFCRESRGNRGVSRDSAKARNIKTRLAARVRAFLTDADGKKTDTMKYFFRRCGG